MRSNKNFKIVWPGYGVKIIPQRKYDSLNYEGRDGKFLIPKDAKMAGL